jgi:hypothetical protein
MRIRPEGSVTRPRGTLFPHKLAITSPTSGGRSVGIVRSRTQTMEFSLVFMMKCVSADNYFIDGEMFQWRDICEVRTYKPSILVYIYIYISISIENSVRNSCWCTV